MTKEWDPGCIGSDNGFFGEHGRGISEGQAQRLSIARALIRHSKILLLDEATSALDMDTEKQVIQNIIKADPKKIIIVSTHRPSVLQMCRTVYRIEDGKIFQVDGNDEMIRLAQEEKKYEKEVHPIVVPSKPEIGLDMTSQREKGSDDFWNF